MARAVVPDTSDLTLRSDGTVTAIQNVLAENAQNAVLLELNEGQAVTAPVQVPFVQPIEEQQKYLLLHGDSDETMESNTPISVHCIGDIGVHYIPAGIHSDWRQQN